MCIILMRMNDTLLTIWQAIVQFMLDPAVISGIGSILIAVLAFCSRTAKAKIVKWLAKLKKRVELATRHDHVIDDTYGTTSMFIYNVITKLRGQLDCSRVAILQFRNGTLFTLSAPMFRVYCSYEALRNGVASSCRDFSERLGTTILEFIGPLFSDKVQMDGVTEITSCNTPSVCARAAGGIRLVKFETNEMPYCEFQCMLKRAGIRVLYAAVLKSGNNPIGVLTLHYLVEHDADKQLSTHACELCEAVNLVQNALDARVID